MINNDCQRQDLLRDLQEIGLEEVSLKSILEEGSNRRGSCSFMLVLCQVLTYVYHRGRENAALPLQQRTSLHPCYIHASCLINPWLSQRHAAANLGPHVSMLLSHKNVVTSFSTPTFRCIKSEMTVEMCGAPRQLHGWHTHVSTAIVPLATLRGDAGKLLIMWKQLVLRVMCTSETH